MVRSGDRGRGHGDAETPSGRLSLIWLARPPAPRLRGDGPVRPASRGRGRRGACAGRRQSVRHRVCRRDSARRAVSIRAARASCGGCPDGQSSWWPAASCCGLLARQRTWLTFSADCRVSAIRLPDADRESTTTRRRCLIALALVGVRVPTSARGDRPCRRDEPSSPTPLPGSFPMIGFGGLPVLTSFGSPASSPLEPCPGHP